MKTARPLNFYTLSSFSTHVSLSSWIRRLNVNIIDCRSHISTSFSICPSLSASALSTMSSRSLNSFSFLLILSDRVDDSSQPNRSTSPNLSVREEFIRLPSKHLNNGVFRGNSRHAFFQYAGCGGILWNEGCSSENFGIGNSEVDL